MQERKVLEQSENNSDLSQDSENYTDEQLKERKRDQDVAQSQIDDAIMFFEIKWRGMRNVDKKNEDDDFDYLGESIIIQTQKVKNELSICDDRDDIYTLQSELDHSMAVK